MTSQQSPRPDRTTSATADAPSWTRPGRAIVVGVDGSERSKAALYWAIQEAESTGRPLTLLSVMEAGDRVPRPRREDDTAVVRTGLATLAQEIRDDHPGLVVTTDVVLGPAVHSLVSSGAEHNQIVLGRRGLGSLHRLLVGSTSIGVAGRSPVPVVIVPDDWRPAEHATAPVVVGVDPEAPHRQTLLHAFNEAQRRNVELRLVHALDVEGTLVWDPVQSIELIDHWRSRASSVVEDALAELSQSFPSVHARFLQEATHPAGLLLEQGLEAQLLVIGRHAQGALGGFALGSVARAVLHHATCPVAVVPDDSPSA